MTKPRAFNPEQVKQKLIDIEQGKNISYETLMKRYKKMWPWAKQRLKDEETQKRLKRIQKRALKVSIRRIANGSPINHSYLTLNYGYLAAAAGRVYERDNRKCPVQVWIEDAGVEYFQKSKQRNLKQILEDIAEVGENPRDFTTKYFYETNGGLGKVVKNRFGSIGKGVILVGIDYLQKRNSNIKTKRHKYYFTLDELASITQDKSLTDKEKGACLFNALSLQYYDFSDFRSGVHRETDRDVDKRKIKKRTETNSLIPGFKSVIKKIEEPIWFGGEDYDVLEKDSYSKYGIEIGLSHAEIRTKDDREKPLLFRTRLCLDKDIKNPIHDTRFYFTGIKLGGEDYLTKGGVVYCPGGLARLGAIKFYMDWNTILNNKSLGFGFVDSNNPYLAHILL